MDRVKLLVEYGSFLKNNHLDKLAEENRQFLTLSELHLIKSAPEFSVDDLLKMSVTNLTKLLETFEKGEITRDIIKKILKLELDGLPGLKPEYIDPNDLLSIYTAQKQAVLCFIPKFTSDAEKAKKLTQELELTFLQALDFTIGSYVKQQVEAAEKLTEIRVREETAGLFNQELQKLQEELNISNEELRNRNENLENLQQALITRQEELVSKEIELTRSTQYLEQFVNIASHDLQEPLRMIISYLQLIEKRYKETVDKDLKEFIGFTVDGAKRMKTLIEGLLDFSRIGTRGKAFEKIDTNKVLTQVINNLRLKIEDIGAKITYGSLPEIMGDEAPAGSVIPEPD